MRLKIFEEKAKAVLCLALLLVLASQSRAAQLTLSIRPASPVVTTGDTLVQHGTLKYEGAFRLPHGQIAGSSFDYGGTALAFNPARNSLFMVGHDWQQQVAEVTVPAIRIAATVAELDTAAVLQPFAEVTEGRMPQAGDHVGGLLPYHGKLYVTVYRYYDALVNATASHFVSGLDLSVTGDVLGPFRTTTRIGLAAGYFGLVPAAWQAALGGPVLNGQCCIPIISRTSYGPGVFTIDPEQIGPTPVTATPLVYYEQEHQTLGAYGQIGQANLLFNGATQMGGVVFPEGTRSVLFFGRQGIGPYCYGLSEDCGDLAATGKGEHSYPYVPYVWAYDALDLAAVKRGEKMPWDVTPYATWALTLPFQVPYAQILGATYDPATGRIFLTQAHGDGDFPLVHVFTVRLA